MRTVWILKATISDPESVRDTDVENMIDDALRTGSVFATRKAAIDTLRAEVQEECADCDLLPIDVDAVMVVARVGKNRLQEITLDATEELGLIWMVRECVVR